MKLSIALGIAAAALTVAAASAQSTSRHVMIHHGGGHGDMNLDANSDGWLTRAEASSAYERIFADLDTNDDGKLDNADRREIHINGPHVRVLRGDGDHQERHVRVITHGGDVNDEEIELEIERAMEEAEVHVERAERDAEHAEREAERAEREAERHAHHDDDGERHVEREVIIIRNDGGDGQMAPVPPVPPVPHVPPMPFMMLIANSEEADRDGDGALNRDEFVAQHLRFFDASDANGDGRIRFEAPPAPPEPPAPPAPPEPPRRR